MRGTVDMITPKTFPCALSHAALHGPGGGLYVGRVDLHPIQTLALHAATTFGSGHCHFFPLPLSPVSTFGPFILGPSSGSVQVSPCEEHDFPTERLMTPSRTAHLPGLPFLPLSTIDA